MCQIFATYLCVFLNDNNTRYSSVNTSSVLDSRPNLSYEGIYCTCSQRSHAVGFIMLLRILFPVSFPASPTAPFHSTHSYAKKPS